MYAIVVLNYNAGDDTIRLVDSLASLNCHFIVVDNCSKDGSRDQLLRYSDGRERFRLILSETNCGYAQGNNIGLKAAHSVGCVAAFVLNPDVIVENLMMFARCLELVAEPNVLACAPSIAGVSPYYLRPKCTGLLCPPLHRMRELRKHKKLINSGQEYFDVYKIYGCFVCYNLERFHELEYFDEETFLYFEESIIAEKALAKCYRQLVLIDKNILHKAQGSISGMGKRQFKFFYESCYIYLYHYRGFSVFVAKVLSFIDVVSRAVVNKLRGMW